METFLIELTDSLGKAVQLELEVTVGKCLPGARGGGYTRKAEGGN